MRGSAGRSYQLKGVFLRGAKLDTLVDEGFEVALADVGGNFGPELGGDDGPLQEAALQRRRRGVNDVGGLRVGAGRGQASAQRWVTLAVGVCATLFCVTVDVVFDIMPALVWALTAGRLWLGDDTRLASGWTGQTTSMVPSYKIFLLFGATFLLIYQFISNSLY